ncbi:MAG: hypothetical protein AAB776_01740, partial [Patescibacteria group bacterium]
NKVPYGMIIKDGQGWWPQAFRACLNHSTLPSGVTVSSQLQTLTKDELISLFQIPELALNGFVSIMYALVEQGDLTVARELCNDSDQPELVRAAAIFVLGQHEFEAMSKRFFRQGQPLIYSWVVYQLAKKSSGDFGRLLDKNPKLCKRINGLKVDAWDRITEEDQA